MLDRVAYLAVEDIIKAREIRAHLVHLVKAALKAVPINLAERILHIGIADEGVHVACSYGNRHDCPCTR